jgi:hypothetical protein
MILVSPEAAQNAEAGFILPFVKKGLFPVMRRVSFHSYQTIGIPSLLFFKRSLSMGTTTIGFSAFCLHFHPGCD